MKALTNFKDMVKTSISEGAEETKLVPIVYSGRAAAIIAKKWIKSLIIFPMLLW